MIKQRLNEIARALLREFCAKDSLGECQTVSEIGDNRDEIIRLQLAQLSQLRAIFGIFGLIFVVKSCVSIVGP
jgi:hypothetical protein